MHFCFASGDGHTRYVGDCTDVCSSDLNHAPTATNLSAAESYTEDTPLNLTDIVVSDVDSANVTATLTLSNLAAGSLSTAKIGRASWRDRGRDERGGGARGKSAVADRRS